MRYVILLVPLLALLALACNGGGEAQPTATQSPAVLEPTTTQTAAEPTLAVETGGIQGFRVFARLIEQAIAEKDSQFFVERAVLSEGTCTGEEVLGPCPGQPAGTTLTGILGYFVPGDADWPEEYAQVLDQYFGAALGEMSDEYGSGSLVLYALFQIPDSEGTATFLAITTSIVDTVQTAEYVLTGREVHAFRFQFEDGRWRFTEELVASVTAGSPLFLEPPPGENSVDWERWKGSAP